MNGSQLPLATAAAMIDEDDASLSFYGLDRLGRTESPQQGPGVKASTLTGRRAVSNCPERMHIGWHCSWDHGKAQPVESS